MDPDGLRTSENHEETYWFPGTLMVWHATLESETVSTRGSIPVHAGS